MSILNSGTALDRIVKFLKKVFKGKPATIAELQKTARNIGINEKEVDRVIAAFKSEETTDLNKVDDLMDSTKVDDANLTKALDRVDTMSGDDLLREAQTAQLDITAPLTRSMSDPSDVKGVANLKGPAGRNNSDAVVGMPDGVERSIKFVGERTGLPDSIVKKALKIKMMEGYEAGNYKGLANEAEDMKAFVDTQIMGDDTLTFLEEIEQIGKELIDDRGVGSMTEAFDNAMDAKKITDKAKGGRVGFDMGGYASFKEVIEQFAEGLSQEEFDLFIEMPRDKQIEIMTNAGVLRDDYNFGGRVGLSEGGEPSMERVLELEEQGFSYEEAYEIAMQELLDYKGGFAAGGPVAPQRGPMHAGIGQMFKKR